MPARGKNLLASRTGNKRVLRVHNKSSAAGELLNFFSESAIPRFNDQILEAYIKAIAPTLEEFGRETQSPQHTLEDSSQHEESQGSYVSTRPTDDGQLSERSISPESSSKVYLLSGLFSEVQQNKRSTKQSFRFPLPVSSTHALDRVSNFLLPYSIYCPSRTKEPVWKNLKKSMIYPDFSLLEYKLPASSPTRLAGQFIVCLLISHEANV